MTTPRRPLRTDRRPAGPRVAAPLEPSDPARIGRGWVRRQARGSISATMPLLGSKTGQLLYEVDWDGPRPPHNPYNRFTSIELRLVSEEP